jgi:hypothetical protein
MTSYSLDAKGWEIYDTKHFIKTLDFNFAIIFVHTTCCPSLLLSECDDSKNAPHVKAFLMWSPSPIRRSPIRLKRGILQLDLHQAIECTPR